MLIDPPLALSGVDPNEVLVDREKSSTQICEVSDRATDPRGIAVPSVELNDIILADGARHLRTVQTVNSFEHRRRVERHRSPFPSKYSRP